MLDYHRILMSCSRIFLDSNLEKLAYEWLKTQNQNEKSRALRAGFKANEMKLQFSHDRNSLCTS